MNRSGVQRLSQWGLVLALLVAVAGCNQSQVAPTANPSDNPSTQAKPSKKHKSGIIPGLPALPKVKVPGPLGIKNGPVPPRTGIRTLATGDKVQLKFLIIANDSNDFGIATWKAILDQVGAPYDVLLAQTTPLTSGSLVDTDGTGKYSAILLTNNSLLYQDGSGNYLSAFDGTEWNTLWDYERGYKVRQVSLYTSYGTFPEDYCLRPISEGGVSATPLNATLTSAGATIFNELKTGVVIPITYSYVYRNSIATGTACTGATATSVLNSGTDILGVTSTTTDGRQRLALTFTSNVNLLQSSLLTYNLIRWASKGVFLGERKHYINVDVDDWFNTSDERLPDGSFTSGYRMSAQDALSTFQIQTALVNQYASTNVLPQFSINVAYNAGDAVLTAPSFGTTGAACNINQASTDPLTSTSRCLVGDFRWINHTLTHPKMQNYTQPGNPPCPVITAANIRTEIRTNFQIGNNDLSLWITNKSVLKTGEYSGLGVYHPNCNNDIDPPTDYGLGASNPDLLNEAALYGIKYLHGNMSFPSHRPNCFNCGTYHPMKPSLLLVPDWPTNIAYFAINPAEEVSIYNCFFGPNATCANGQFRYWPNDLNYTQIIEAETDLAFQQHVATGSVYTHTMHVGNLTNYTAGQNLTFDWISRLVAKYATYYKTPLRNPTWNNLGAYVAWRTDHFKTLGGTKAVWDRALNTVTVTSSTAGTLYLTGATATGAVSETYGGNTISRLTLTAGTPVNLTPATYVATLGLASNGIGLQDLPDSPVSTDEPVVR